MRPTASLALAALACISFARSDLLACAARAGNCPTDNCTEAYSNENPPGQGNGQLYMFTDAAGPTCTDTNYGAADSYGDDCASWASNSWRVFCSRTDWDDDDFTVRDMCCECGGTLDTSVPTITPAPTIECPHAKLTNSKKCVFLTEDYYPFDQCDKACGDDAALVCIPDYETNQELRQFLGAYDNDNYYGEYWIGFYTKSGDWSDGWGPGATQSSCPYYAMWPDSHPQGGCDDCAASHHWGWASRNCYSEKRCVCEYGVESDLDADFTFADSTYRESCGDPSYDASSDYSTDDSCETGTAFRIDAGDCTACGECFHTPNYLSGDQYANDQYCTITPLTSGWLDVLDFSTETYFDYVNVDGIDYDGTTGPEGVAVTTSSSISFYSDGSVTDAGAHICMSQTPPSTSITWLLAALSQSCSDKCQESGRTCAGFDEFSLGADEMQSLFASAGVTCTNMDGYDTEGDYRPGVLIGDAWWQDDLTSSIDDGHCWWGTTLSTCDSSGRSDVRRLCPCECTGSFANTPQSTTKGATTTSTWTEARTAE